MHQQDVVLAYLHGELDVNLYIEQPEGFKTGDRVYKLIRALYGLKQSTQVWNLHSHQELIHLSQQPLQTEPYIYMLREEQDIKLIIVIYVNDLLLTGPDDELTETFE